MRRTTVISYGVPICLFSQAGLRWIEDRSRKFVGFMLLPDRTAIGSICALLDFLPTPAGQTVTQDSRAIEIAF
jgi:hypothetical protein